MARVTGKRRGVFGNNSANKDSRQGGEDLAEEMAEEDPLTGLPLKSAGRAVVEARRSRSEAGQRPVHVAGGRHAVGRTARGDGGERLRIVPPSMMPQIR